MIGYLFDFGGKSYEMPPILEWDIRHTLGDACDSFDIVLVYRSDMLEILRSAVRFRAVHDGETVFFGVVDEFEIRSDIRGLVVSVRGRGLAALLMDNEAEAAQYFSASAQFILERHVYPFGITEVRTMGLPSAAVFVVEFGESQWSVLENFAWFIGGVRPRFSREGVLILQKEEGKKFVIDRGTGVSSEVYREVRYGVISSAMVKIKAWGIGHTVENHDFIARGGNSRRVINVPRNTSYDAMRHTGEYQINRSQENSIVSEITLTDMFAAFPGDVVHLEGSSAGTGVTGEFIVKESRCRAGADSAGTMLTLVKKQ